MTEPSISGDGRTVTVRVPISIRQARWPEARPRARRHRSHRRARHPACRQRHGQGDRPGVPLARNAGERRVRDHREIAAAEKINETYVGRVLRLTLLAPDIVEAILGGRQPAGLQLDGLMRRFPVGWREQRRDITRPEWSLLKEV